MAKGQATIFQRTAALLRARDWAAVGIELLIVAVGVLLGIEAANWNDARRDHALEKRFLADLHEDLIKAERTANRVSGRRIKYSALLNQTAIKLA